MNAMIHPTAIVDPEARLGSGVTVGPYACIGAGVELGEGCAVGAHAVLEGPISAGADNRIGPHAVLGVAPQDRSYRDEPTRLEIGDRNIIREFATIHRASTKEDRVTRIGNDNLFMAYSHVGHDCRIGDHVTLANATNLGGHVTVHDHVNFSALCGVHQFVRIGAHAMISGGTIVRMDIPPYAMASGDRAKLTSLNRRGLQRNGFDIATIRAIHLAYRLLFQSGLRLEEALQAIEQQTELRIEPVRYLVTFIRESKRGITR